MANSNSIMRGTLLSPSPVPSLLGTAAPPLSLPPSKTSFPPKKTSLPVAAPSLLVVRAASSSASASAAAVHGSGGKSPIRRRQGLILSLSVAAAALLAGESMSKEVVVGAYLPPVPSKLGFVQFQATSKDTPALRAGNVQPYSFFLPPTWKQTRVANILSGNYCQPKCAEPWVEVKFEDVKQGSVQVVASPLVRLTNKPNATIEEIGNPEKLISALGPFVTGNSYDPDEVVEIRIEKRGTQTYYTYALETPYARTGSHNLATATAKGNVVMLFVVSASDSQWSSSESTLRTMVESFQI